MAYTAREAVDDAVALGGVKFGGLLGGLRGVGVDLDFEIVGSGSTKTLMSNSNPCAHAFVLVAFTTGLRWVVWISDMTGFDTAGFQIVRASTFLPVSSVLTSAAMMSSFIDVKKIHDVPRNEHKGEQHQNVQSEVLGRPILSLRNDFRR